jgi:hypothetical protein
MPFGFESSQLSSWKSRLFTIPYPIDSYSIHVDSDGEDWSFSDELIESQLPQTEGADLLLVITAVPLEDNYHTRRVRENVLVFTFHEVASILRAGHIPLVNAVLRILYSCCLVHRRAGGRIPLPSEPGSWAHDETRGCIYDMTGLKADIAVSCSQLSLCASCQERCAQENVPTSVLESVQREVRKVRRPLFYRLADAVAAHPIAAILISSAWAFALSVAASLLVTRLQ